MSFHTIRMFPVAMLAAALACFKSGPAWAADECGTATPSAPVVCDSRNYDASSEGNVFYQLPDSPADADYRFELKSGIRIVGRRDAAQVPVGDQTDDHSRRWNKSGELWANYGAFFVDTGFDYTGDITIRSEADIDAGPASGVTIDQATIRARGIYARHLGKHGNINVHVDGGTITSTGPGVEARIDALYSGSNTGFPGDDFRDEENTGNILLEMTGGFIRTTGDDGVGLGAYNRGGGAVRVVARKGSLDDGVPDIRTTGTDADGIQIASGSGSFTAPGPDPDDVNLEVLVENLHIETRGDGSAASDGAKGIRTNLLNPGLASIDVRNSRIVTRGTYGDGIYHLSWPTGVPGEGPLRLRVSDSVIMTEGAQARGIFVQGYRDGLVDVEMRDSVIETSSSASFTHPISIWRFGQAGSIQGDTRVRVVGGRVVAKGEHATQASHGITVNYYQGSSGNVDIDLIDTDVRSVTGYGVRVTSLGGIVDISVDGGRVHGQGGGIYVSGPGGVGADGVPMQQVRANGEVAGTGPESHGVHLRGGGLVVVGPEGTVRPGAPSSGAAILSEGSEADLTVSIDLNGRRISDVVGGVIRNDRGMAEGAVLGRTTIALNGVRVFDGTDADGVVAGVEVPNGPYDISIPRSAFSTTDGSLSIDIARLEAATRAAPRAGVYEVMPDMLLRLTDGGEGRRLRAADSPLWLRVSGGQDRYVPARSDFGGKYRLNRYDLEVGVELPLTEGLSGDLGVHYRLGAGRVRSDAGDGKIDVTGYGVSIGATWRQARLWSRLRAGFSRYDVDASTGRRGTLVKGARASGLSFRLEGGYRHEVDTSLVLTPLVWGAHSRAGMPAVTDRLSSRIKIRDGTRTAIGSGIRAVWHLDVLDGLRLDGLAGIEHLLDGKTTVGIGVAQARSTAVGQRGILGLGAAVRLGGIDISARLHGNVGSRGNAGYSGTLAFSTRF